MGTDRTSLSYDSYKGHAGTCFRVPPRAHVPFIQKDPKRYRLLKQAVGKYDKLPVSCTGGILVHESM